MGRKKDWLIGSVVLFVIAFILSLPKTGPTPVKEVDQLERDRQALIEASKIVKNQ